MNSPEGLKQRFRTRIGTIRNFWGQEIASECSRFKGTWVHDSGAATRNILDLKGLVNEWTWKEVYGEAKSIYRVVDRCGPLELLGWVCKEREDKSIRRDTITIQFPSYIRGGVWRNIRNKKTVTSIYSLSGNLTDWVWEMTYENQK